VIYSTLTCSSPTFASIASVQMEFHIY